MTVLSPTTLTAILTAYAAETPLSHIGAAHHISPEKVRRILQKEGVYHMPTLTFNAANQVCNARRAERDGRILDLWRQGVGLCDVATRMDVSRDTVRKVLKRAGVRVPGAHRGALTLDRCRCCEIVLSESGDARHGAECADGLCWDCAQRYVWNGETWVRRAEYVVEVVPLPCMGDVRVSMDGWAMLEVEM